MKPFGARDHGGGLDAAMAGYGGERADWLDLSTGINPHPYPLPRFAPQDWTALPDAAAMAALETAARGFWGVPAGAALLAAPGASALIARIPALMPKGRVRVAERTYNEHAGAFSDAGWQVVREGESEARVIVHPNNPTGTCWTATKDGPARGLLVIDESFCDIAPDQSHIGTMATAPGVVILKSLGKFWGLAGARLGFAIGDPAHIAALARMLGPWPVSGPAIAIGTAALRDTDWADRTRQRLQADSARLDAVMEARGATLAGGTTLFRLYDVGDAQDWQDRLARGRIWSRAFPYDARWLRLGLPPEDRWDQLEAALP